MEMYEFGHLSDDTLNLEDKQVEKRLYFTIKATNNDDFHGFY